jgi:hypothetical protein
MNTLQNIADIPANTCPDYKIAQITRKLFLSPIHTSNNIINNGATQEENVSFLSYRLPSQGFSSCPRPDKLASLT